MKFTIFTFLFFFYALYMIFFYAPIEANQGVVQKIFYLHVAAAITMYVGFFIAFLSSAVFLFQRKRIWDLIASSGVEVGFLFCSIVLLTGPFWARPVWGVWWTWEPRLTTTFLLWLMYAAYLLLRSAFDDVHRGKVVSAILGVFAFILVPLVHFSVRLWKGVHPSVLREEGGLPSSMQVTLVVSVIAVLLLFACLFRARFQIERDHVRLDELREKRMFEEA